MAMSLALSLALGSGNVPSGGSAHAGDAILLESGSYILLEDGSSRLLNEVTSALEPTTSLTQVTHRSATFKFSKAMQVGWFVGGATDGQPFVVADSSFTVTQITPDTQNFATTADYVSSATGGTIVAGTNYEGNGAMWCPYFTPYLDDDHSQAVVQGFDQIVSVAALSGAGARGIIPYSAGANIDPAKSGAFAVASGTSGSLVKSVRRSGFTTPDDPTWRRFDDWCVLHVVPAAPPLDSYPPSPALAVNEPERINYVTKAMRTSAWLGSGFTAVTNVPSFATVVSGGYLGPTFKPHFGQMGEYLRMFVINPALASNDSSGYSRDYSLMYSQYLAAMMQTGSGATDAEIDKVLTIGLQWLGLAYRGAQGSSTGGPSVPFVGIVGAGQAAGYKVFMHAANMACWRNRPDYDATVRGFRANPTHQQFWATSTLVGTPARQNGNHNQNGQTFLPVHVDRPHWMHTLYQRPPVLDTRFDSCPDADYENGSAGDANNPEMMVMCMMRDGPNGWDGSQVVANGASDTPRTEESVSVAYMDRYRTWSTPALDIMADGSDTVLGIFARALYDARRTSCALVVGGVAGAAYTTTPDPATPISAAKQAVSTGLGTNLLIAGAASFSWDLRNVGQNTETITDQQIQYSLDDMSWVNTTTQALNGTQSSLPIKTFKVRWRRKSAKGWGPWSVNFEQRQGVTGVRMNVTPTGSPSGTATNTVAPVLYYKPYPQWWGPWYETLVTSPFDPTIDRLFAGVGMWTGTITGGFTYQWQNGTGGVWSDIASQTSADYYWVFADQGLDVRCKITSVSGTVVAFTNSVAIPVISEVDLLVLRMVVAPPSALVTYLTNYVADLKASAHGDLYAKLDLLYLPLHTAQASRLNLKTPGGSRWDLTYINTMQDTDFLPYLGWYGDGISGVVDSGKGLETSFADTPPAGVTVNWSRDAASLIAHVNATTNAASGVSVWGLGAGGSCLLIPNISANVRGRVHTGSNQAGPASSSARTGWFAAIRENSTQGVNYKEATRGTVNVTASSAPHATDTMAIYKGGTNLFCADRADVIALGALTELQYLDFRTITNGLLAQLATL